MNRFPVSTACAGIGARPVRRLWNAHLLASTALVFASVLSFGPAEVHAQQIDVAAGETTTITTSTPFDDINFLGDGTITGVGPLRETGSPTRIDVAGGGSAVIETNIVDGAGGNGVLSVNGNGGSGTLTLTGNNTYSSGTSVQNGTLILNNADGNAIRDNASLVASGSAIIEFKTDEVIGRLGGNGKFLLNSNTITLTNTSGDVLNGSISGAGNIVIDTGGGEFDLAGENTFTGSTTINSGTLNLGRFGIGGAVIPDANSIVVNGGELNIEVSETIGSLAGTGGMVTVPTTNLGGAQTLTTGGNNASTTFGGSFSGPGIVDKRGTGTFTLSGDNTGFDGTIEVSEGTLSLATTAAAGDGSFSITTTGSVIDYADGVTSAAPININSNTTQLQVLAGTATQSGVISETGGARPLEKIGDGTLILAGKNTYTGGTTLTAGTLGFAGPNLLAISGDLIINGGTLDLSDRSLSVGNLSGTGGVIKASDIFDLLFVNQTVNGTYAGDFSGTTLINAPFFSKTGGATLTLSGNNTITGGGTFEVLGGTLRLDGGNAIGDSMSLSIFGEVELLADETIGLFDGNGALNLNNNTLTLGIEGDSTLKSFFGVISGTGGITMDDATGVLGDLDIIRLRGANTFTGPLTINAGGVILQNGAALADTVDVVLAGDARAQLQIDNSETIGSLSTGVGSSVTISGGQVLNTNGTNASTVVAGTISGGGSLVKEGTGTLTLSGANTYTGGTTVAGGTLSLQNDLAAGLGTITTTGSVIDYGNGVTIANTVNVNSNTTQLQVLTGAATQSGVISETGGARPLEKIGDGRLDLTAINTYTGITTVTAGTLGLTGAGSLASTDIQINEGSLFTDGDALAAGATFSLTDGLFDVQGNETVTGLENDGGTVSISVGSVFTAGAINQSGGLFTSEGFTTGPFTLNGGTLAGNGTFNGNVTANGGFVSPGNSIGTQIINGDYTLNSGSTFVVEVTQGAADQVIVNGVVAVNGATLSVDDLAPALTDPNASFIIVANDGGDAVIGTGFSTIIDNLAFLTPLIDLTGGDGNDIELSFNVEPVDLASVAQTPNQRATGAGLNSASTTDPGIQNLLLQFVPLTTTQAQTALDSLSGEVHASSQFAFNSNGLFVANSITNALNGLNQGDGTGKTGNSPTDIAVQALGIAPGQTAERVFGPDVALNEPGSAGDVDRRFMFAHGLFRQVSIEADGNGAQTDIRNGGFIGGGGININSNFSAGLGAGYLSTNVDIDARESNADIDSAIINAFGQYRSGDIDITATLGYIYSNVETERGVRVGAFNETASADYDANSVFGNIELGYTRTYNGFAFRPFIGGAFAITAREGFTETGAAAANLTASSSTDALGQVTVGASASTSFNLGSVLVIPHVEAAFDQLIGDSTPAVTAAFRPGGNPFDVIGATPGTTRGRIGAGFAAKLSSNITGFVDYQGTFSANDTEHAIGSGIKIKF
ncbi:MAG: autotransporter domain-containing protein [Stappiaceae bacterium]